MLPESNLARVSVCDLTKRYGSVEALKGITFSVAPGEVFGLIGSNGAGKTTTLECILGLREPTSGRVELDGRDLAQRVASDRARIGAQIQGATLQDKITPRRALDLFSAFHTKAAPLVPLAAEFGLTEKLDAPFDSLSAGQRQRLFLALAVVGDPQLVVLDEPTSGLDPRARRELHDLILAMGRGGRTVLLSTHDLAEASSLCGRVGILDHGRLLAVGTPAEIISMSGAQVSTLEDAFLELTARVPGEKGEAK